MGFVLGGALKGFGGGLMQYAADKESDAEEAQEKLWKEKLQTWEEKKVKDSADTAQFNEMVDETISKIQSSGVDNADQMAYTVAQQARALWMNGEKDKATALLGEESETVTKPPLGESFPDVVPRPEKSALEHVGEAAVGDKRTGLTQDFITSSLDRFMPGYNPNQSEQKRKLLEIQNRKSGRG